MVNWDVTKGFVSVERCAVLLPTLQCVQHRLTAQIVDHRSGATKLLRLHSVSPKWRFQVFDWLPWLISHSSCLKGINHLKMFSWGQSFLGALQHAGITPSSAAVWWGRPCRSTAPFAWRVSLAVCVCWVSQASAKQL